MLKDSVHNIPPYGFYVYQLIYKNEVVYIGSSENILLRIGNHILSDKKFDSFLFEECNSFLEMRKLEFLKIIEKTPKYNLTANVACSGYVSIKTAKQLLKEDDIYLSIADIKRKIRDGELKSIKSYYGDFIKQYDLSIFNKN